MKAARIASSVFMALRSPFSSRAVADEDTVDTLPCIAPIPPPTPPPPLIACETDCDCELTRERIESPCCSSSCGGRRIAFSDVRLIGCAGSCRDAPEEFCLVGGG